MRIGGICLLVLRVVTVSTFLTLVSTADAEDGNGHRLEIGPELVVQWNAREPMIVRLDFGTNLIPLGGVIYDTGQGPPYRLGLTANRQFCLSILFGL